MLTTRRRRTRSRAPGRRLTRLTTPCATSALFGCKLTRALLGLRRVGILSERPQAGGFAGPGPAAQLVQSQRLVVERQRALVAVETCQRVTLATQRIGVVWLDGERAVERGHRFVVALQRIQRVAGAGPGGDVVRIERQRMLVHTNGLVIAL